MDKEYAQILAEIRLDRAMELLKSNLAYGDNEGFIWIYGLNILYMMKDR